MGDNKAWVTLATTDGYAVGALVLAHSLRNVQTKYKLHVLYTNGVSSELRDQLKAAFDHSTEVDVMNSNDSENLALIGRPDLGVTFTKLHCWRLTQYSKCVFLDADTFMLKNSDELFEHPEFSAAPDIGWPDYFNTGVFVYVPSLDTYRKLVEFAVAEGSFDGGDQGLLNKYFDKWREQDVAHRLSFLYNVTTAAIYSYAAAIKMHAPEIKIIHFLGKQKPWQHYHSGGVGYVSEFLQKWFKVYQDLVVQHLPAPLASNAMSSMGNTTKEEEVVASSTEKTQKSAIESSSSSSSTSTTSKPKTRGSSETEERFNAWELGKPDYEGHDSFDNIQKMIDSSLGR